MLNNFLAAGISPFISACACTTKYVDVRFLVQEHRAEYRVVLIVDEMWVERMDMANPLILGICLVNSQALNLDHNPVRQALVSQHSFFGR